MLSRVKMVTDRAYTETKRKMKLFSDGGKVHNLSDEWARFTVIVYDNSSGQFVFSARRFNSRETGYICQLNQNVNGRAYTLFIDSQYHTCICLGK